MIVFRDNWPASITIEIEDRDFFRERGKNGKMGGALMPTKNRAHGARKGGGKYITARQAWFRKSIALNCGGLELGLGAYALKVEQECRLHRPVGVIDFPLPDSDACLTAIRDAIQARDGFSGLIKDDCQIVDNCITSTISTASPRVCSLRIELVAMTGQA